MAIKPYWICEEPDAVYALIYPGDLGSNRIIVRGRCVVVEGIGWRMLVYPKARGPVDLGEHAGLPAAQRIVEDWKG